MLELYARILTPPEEPTEPEIETDLQHVGAALMLLSACCTLGGIGALVWALSN